MIPLLVVSVCGDHEADSLVEHVYLVRLQVLDGRGQLAQQLCYEWLCLPHLRIDSTIGLVRSQLLLSNSCLPAEMSSAFSGLMVRCRVGCNALMLVCRLPCRRQSWWPTCRMMNFRLHLWQIFRKVSQAMSWTPGCISCMNSNSLFTTVFRNFQWFRRNRGYCPTTYLQMHSLMSRQIKMLYQPALLLAAQGALCSGLNSIPSLRYSILKTTKRAQQTLPKKSQR